ncbi:MAG TPA: HAD-IIA family hydrolase [Roseiflexaceae bacterium]|nr:HAD-IIA family hydrolase [Roseiflexaceae bacterium]
MLDLNRFDALLLDMDGVLYRGKLPLPGVNELLALCHERGVAYACVTNNATMTPSQYEAKLGAMGIHMPAERIITSPVATRRYLEAEAPRGTGIYCVGMAGLREALFGDGYFREDDERPAYVVVGMDFEVCYRQLRRACLHIRAGARFIGTNPDTTFPAEDGIVPGCGALLALLEKGSETAPFVIGKPGATMFHAAVALLGADPARTLTVGDRLDTDIAGSLAAGLASALVLTGVTSREHLERSPVRPDAVFADLPELVAAWRER